MFCTDKKRHSIPFFEIKQIPSREKIAVEEINIFFTNFHLRKMKFILFINSIVRFK